MTNKILEGSCKCGAVIFETSENPVIELCCHCTNCRDATKQPFAKIAFFKISKVIIKGETKSHPYVADSKNGTARESCKTCGSILFDTSEGFPRLIGIMAENIRAPYEFKPSCHVWTISKSAEVDIEQGVKIFEKGLS